MDEGSVHGSYQIAFAPPYGETMSKVATEGSHNNLGFQKGGLNLFVRQNNSSDPLLKISSETRTSSPNTVMFSVLVHWPIVQCQPIMQACFFTLTPRIMVQRERRTPASIVHSWPIETSGPIKQPLPILAVSSTMTLLKEVEPIASFSGDFFDPQRIQVQTEPGTVVPGSTDIHPEARKHHSEQAIRSSNLREDLLLDGCRPKLNSVKSFRTRKVNSCIDLVAHKYLLWLFNNSLYRTVRLVHRSPPLCTLMVHPPEGTAIRGYNVLLTILHQSIYKIITP